MKKKTAYYNEHDPQKAAWLRELICAGLIAPGDVDERSIEDVLPSELAGYAQCHFFAGIGVWSHALRSAGWPDDRPAWSGSCPCQPFSQAGKRKGTTDERHLWPAFHWLIRQCRPDVVFGEQVASRDGLRWLDTVQSDLEAAAYAVGALDLCAAGFGAPHIRQRVFFVADAKSGRGGTFRAGGDQGRSDVPSGSSGESVSLAKPDQQRRQEQRLRNKRRATDPEVARSGEAGQLADSTGQRYDGRRASEASGRTGESERSCNAGQLGNTCGQGFQKRISNRRIQRETVGSSEGQAAFGRGAANGFWQDIEWLYCRDGKYRPTQSGLFPLAHGVAARVAKLRGIGDAIVAPVAEAFIRAYMMEIAR